MISILTASLIAFFTVVAIALFKTIFPKTSKKINNTF